LLGFNVHVRRPTQNYDPEMYEEFSISYTIHASPATSIVAMQTRAYIWG